MVHPQPLHGNRPPFNPPAHPNMLAPPPNDPRQPKPHKPRTSKPPTNIYYTPDIPTSIFNPSLWRHRNHYVLRHIRSHPNPHPDYHHSLRKPDRTPECRHILPILYTSRIPPPPSGPTPPPKRSGHSLHDHPPIHEAPPTTVIQRQNLVGRLSPGFPS